jgi:DNA-binding CsgD family transcriptional regulator
VARLSPDRDDSLLAAGARVVVPATVEADELCAALRLVARGLVGPPRPRRVATACGVGLLTAREAEVLQLLLELRSAQDIADALCVTVATVSTHRRRIYEKLGVHSRRELALSAAQLFGVSGLESGALVAPAADRLAFRRRLTYPRDDDRAVVLDMCRALGARRWLGRDS